MKAKRLVYLIIFFFTFSLIGTRAYAAGDDGNVFKKTEEFEAFADPFMEGAMERYHVPGVILTVVKDGKVLFKKGYGYSDVDKKSKVDADETIFRTGSVSKLLTATAVMQLVEQDKIDLHKDINTYLKDFKIKNDYPKPVTMENLLTHTGGFDESLMYLDKEDLSDPEPLGEYLKKYLPPVIREPGTVIQYSNHGMTLAGYIVELVSGIPFDKYIKENILAPLDMDNSSFVITQRMVPDIAKGYEYKNDKYSVKDLFNINLPPAGAFVTTADDMSRFLIAHLQNGKYKDIKILNESTADIMHKQQFTNYEGISGYAYGFNERIRNKIRVIEQEGYIPHYHSLVSLLPEKKIGFFISTNSDQGASLINDFAEEFYKKVETDDIVDQAYINKSKFNTSIKSFQGKYISTRRSRTGILKYKYLLSDEGDIEVKADGDDKLTLTCSKNQGSFTRVDEELFKNDKGDIYAVFKSDEDGRIYMTLSNNGTSTYERLRWNEGRGGYIFFLVLSTLTFLGVFIVWLIKVIKRVKLKYKGIPGLARLFANTVSILNIVFIIGFLLYLAFSQNLKINLYLLLMLCIPVCSSVLTVLMALLSVLVWKKGYWKIWGRIYYTFITAMSVIFVIILNYLNLVGIKI